MGLLERHGKDGHSTIRTEVMQNVRKGTVQTTVREHVEPGSELFTEALSSYTGLSKDYVHGFIAHAEKYVDGTVHTNGCENFWSLLKRSIKGTYVSVEPFHLFRWTSRRSASIRAGVGTGIGSPR